VFDSSGNGSELRESVGTGFELFGSLALDVQKVERTMEEELRNSRSRTKLRTPFRVGCQRTTRHIFYG
jgi:hypothetical protein